MRNFCAALALMAGPAFADEWGVLDGPGISAILSDRTVDYDAAWQVFNASGTTLYNAGADSWGTWTVRGAQYCSQWPPNSAWSCFDVDISADGSAVRFRGQGSDVTVGLFRRKE
ncbi:MAG: hypothetical protein KJO30_05465 [Boseongicola sp.]|nr:hypothetical protein [Boseongicola sp.]NNJ67488.1 hypothetical protein [Boseongicola sp.]